MKSVGILSFVAFCSSLAVAACSVHNSSEAPELKTGDLVFSTAPEPLKGKQDVYVSMARAAKYNVDTASQNLRKKIYNQNPNLRPQDIVDNVINSNINDESKLYGASRVLEFAVIYALTNLGENQVYIDNNFYEKSAQHLALAAIRSHQDTWFAMKKIKEIDRLMRQQQKTLKELNGRLERNGTLGKNDLHYKKNLEVALLKLSEIQKSLVFSVAEYAELVKGSPKDVNLEGRRFYELEDFDKTYRLEVFQEASVRSRKEFALAKEQVKSYRFDDVRNEVLTRYPLIKRYDINGLTVENEIYNAELQQKAVQIARSLIESVMEFRQAKAGTAEQDVRRKKVFDELAAAILTQQEVGFKLVEMADFDYQAAMMDISAVKSEIRRLEKLYHPAVDDKLELLNKKIELIELERKVSQINGERAMALRGLYFNAGLSPLSKELLKAPLPDIEKALKEAFNRDVTEMMAAASRRPKNEAAAQGNSWAKSSNWLEELIDGRHSAVKSQAPTAAAGNFEPYPDDGKIYKIMQLGAYEDKQNAESDWNGLKERFEGLKAYSPQIERSHVNGQIYFRLQVSSGGGELRALCNQLRAAGQECLLR